MERNQAVDVLVQVAHLAQKGGLLSLQDVPAVLEAIKALQEEDKEEKE
jgi:hypothetical protein